MLLRRWVRWVFFLGPFVAVCACGDPAPVEHGAAVVIFKSGHTAACNRLTYRPLMWSPTYTCHQSDGEFRISPFDVAAIKQLRR